VNSINFLKVLTGDEEGMRDIGSGRVIKRFEFIYLFTKRIQKVRIICD